MSISPELLLDISQLRAFTQIYQNSTPIVYVGEVPLLMHEKGEMGRTEIVQSLDGWLAYAEFADTYKFRRNVFAWFFALFSSAE